MIALPCNLPLLQVGRHDYSAWEPEWVEQGIRNAARAAGHADWWFACDVARSLMLFLRHKYCGTTITLEELNRKVQILLSTIGFKDIGDRFRLTPPQLRVSLHDLALAAEGFELRFFQLLRDRLRELLMLGATQITLHHSRRGVKTLVAARNWSPKCAEMEQNILHYIRANLQEWQNCSVELKS